MLPLAGVRQHAPFLGLLAGGLWLYARSLPALGMFQWDEAEYALLARQMLAGEGFAHPYRLPLFPLSAALASLASGSLADVALKRANLFWSALALLAVYAPVQARYGRAAGLSAAVFLGLAPRFWTSTPRLLTEVAFLGLFAAAIYAFGEGLAGRGACFWLAWTGAGLSALTRYNGMLFLPLASIAACVALAADRPHVWRRLRSPAFLLSPLAFGLPLLAFLVARQRVTGDWFGGFGYALVQLRQFPGEAVVLPWHTYLLWLPSGLGAPCALLALLGAAVAVRRRERVALLSLLVAAFTLGGFSLTPAKAPRLVLGLYPFAAVLAAIGLDAVRRALPVSETLRAAVVPVALVAQAAVATPPARAFLSHARTNGYPAFLQALRHVGSQSSPDARILCDAPPQAAWYSGRRVSSFPERPEELPAQLERSAWALVLDFERAQKDYVGRLVQQLSDADVRRGDVMVFRDGTFTAWAIRSPLLRERLGRQTQEGSGAPEAGARPGP